MVEERSDSRPSSAEEAFARLVELQEAGAAPDVEQWLARYPQFEPELRALIAFRAEAAALRAAGAGPTTVEGSVMYRSRTRSAPTSTPAVDPLTLRPGARFGDFVLLRPIAQGGMGQVWEALQRPLQRIVALKFIRPDRADESAVALFAREARAAGRINDPRIVTVHATGETGSVHWIAQEYVPGECTLSDFLSDVREAGALPPDYFERVAEFFAEVAEAMHVAHQADVVHRDLKPGNILITPDDRPKIADFGLARLIDEASLSGSRAIVGTPHYMSPEQVSGAGHGLDRRSDIFSLGAVLYQALTLRRPFEGATTAELFARITLSDPPDPRTIVSRVPTDLAVIAMKALEKRPEDRYATMADLAADLRRYLADEPIHARPPTTTQRMAKWVRRHPAATAVGVLSLLLAVFLVAFLVTRGEVIDERKRSLIEQILRDIDNGELDAAVIKLQSFARLDPEDPQGHLVLAMGYARYGRMTESRAELDEARAKGYRPDDEVGDSARGLYLRALYKIAERTRDSTTEAVELLQRATSLDPKLSDAWLPLYQACRAIGDDATAAIALAAFKGGLKTGDEQVVLVEALERELRGDLRGALEKLDELRARASPERLVELRMHRHLGRIELELYMRDSEPVRLDAAEQALTQALQVFPDDGGSLACLALVQLEHAKLRKGDGEARERLLALAEGRAEDSLALDNGNVMALEVAASLALERVKDDVDASGNRSIDPVHLEAAEARQEQLLAAYPDNELARSMESDLYFFQGVVAQRNGDRDLALELYEESARAYEEQLPGRVRLGMALYNWLEDRQRARTLLAQTLEIWDRQAARPRPERWSRRWLFGLLTYLVGSADRTGEVELALAARDRMLKELEDPRDVDLADLFTFVEFIATPVHDELRDCASARRLLEEHGLEQAYGGRGGEAQRMLDAIRAACPD